MAVHWATLLIVVGLAFTPESAWAARRVFAGDLLAEATQPSRWRQSPEAHNADPGDDELLDLVHREYDPPFGSYGYGGYGYYGYGYYGYGYGGYGEPAMESDAAFEDLLTRNADLEARHHDHDRKYNRREYDVYGMASSSYEEDARMTRRALRASEEAHLLELDLLADPAHIMMGDPEDGKFDAGDYSQWDDLLGGSLPFPEASPSPYGCYGGYYGGNYGGYYGGYYGGCYGGYGNQFEDLYDDPHNLGLQEALLEVREKLRGRGGGRNGRRWGEEVEELLQ